MNKIMILLFALILLTGCLSTTNANDVAIASIRAQQDSLNRQVAVQVPVSTPEKSDNTMVLMTVLVMSFALATMYMYKPSKVAANATEGPPVNETKILVQMYQLPEDIRNFIVDNGLQDFRAVINTNTGFYELLDANGTVQGQSEHTVGQYKQLTVQEN